MPLFILFFGLLFFLYSKKFNNFYNGKWFDVDLNKNIVSDQQKSGIDILYSNILYTNDDYTWLLKEVEGKNPDMVLMVEFTDDHYQNMKSVLNKSYPYSARTISSQKYFGSVVFSKHPIDDLSTEIHQWTWRYSYFSSDYEWKKYYFYLIHTSSPVSKWYFDMRNKQFDILSDDFAKHQKNISWDAKIVMLWDFNVSPWSIYYDKLQKSLVGMQNITRNFTVLFTWRVFIMPLISSHIDHFFVSEGVKISNLSVLKTPGSDHRWFFIENLK